jgi:hypothetical protein
MIGSWEVEKPFLHPPHYTRGRLGSINVNFCLSIIDQDFDNKISQPLILTSTYVTWFQFSFPTSTRQSILWSQSWEFWWNWSWDKSLEYFSTIIKNASPIKLLTIFYVARHVKPGILSNFEAWILQICWKKSVTFKGKLTIYQNHLYFDTIPIPGLNLEKKIQNPGTNNITLFTSNVSRTALFLLLHKKNIYIHVLFFYGVAVIVIILRQSCRMWSTPFLNKPSLTPFTLNPPKLCTIWQNSMRKYSKTF